MKVGCRWPGGMTLALPRASGLHVKQFVNGPPGVPAISPPTSDKKNKPPSKYAAHAYHKAVVDTVKKLADSTERTYAAHLVGITDIPGDFWNEWYEANKHLDVIKKDLVFPI